MKKFLLILIISIIITLLIIACKKSSSEPDETILKGVVRNAVSTDTLSTYPAYIYSGSTFLASTDVDGNYSISSLTEGVYNLRCSSLYFNDTIESVETVKGKTVTHDFYLQRGTGEIYGEFQDAHFLDSLTVEDPDMADWDEEEIFNETTGATIIGKNLLQFVEKGEVFLGDSLIDRADDWGIYGATLPAGKYTLRGSCAGGENLEYDDKIINVEILPDSIHYYNFILSRKVITKLAWR